MHTLVKIDPASGIPIYKQIVRSILYAVDNKLITQGQQIPSINEIRDAYSISRDTVIKAYQELKTRGIIASSPGKGYYISTSYSYTRRNIFLLLDGFTTYREIFYNAFKDKLGSQAVIDLYFHHYNSNVYTTLLHQANGHYTEYVIVPLTDKLCFDWLQNNLSYKNLYILDLGNEMYGKHYPSVCQNFEKDIYQSFLSSAELFRKYDRLVMVWGEPPDQYRNLIKQRISLGLSRFSREIGLPIIMIDDMKDKTVECGECYFVPNDFDLVTAIEQVRTKKFKLGKDVGLISHNENPLKEVVANGITTLSTDFQEMGRKMASMILKDEKGHFENPSSLIIRGSL
ncbi:GntR family transcriptional regulator [candidate division KSB1 bacterium]|nr:GntR family transcriptional regulator [candidate division KSB1 bacterium]